MSRADAIANGRPDQPLADGRIARSTGPTSAGELDEVLATLQSAGVTGLQVADTADHGLTKGKPSAGQQSRGA